MKVAAVIERDDGGADVVLENITQYELQAIIQAGFVTLIEEMAKKEEEKKRIPAILRGNEE